jgi:hypothetical protein
MAKEFVRAAFDGAPLIPVEYAPAHMAAAVPNITIPHGVTREALVEAHGEGIGGGLFELQQQPWRKAAEQVKVLQDRVSELQGQREQIRKDGEIRLAELEREMNARRDNWLRACNAYEAQRLGIQHATAPLDHEISDIQRQLNRSPHEARVKQWEPRPDFTAPTRSRDV